MLQPVMTRFTRSIAALAALGLAAGWLSAPAAAAPAAPPDYPASAKAADVTPWLAAHTSLRQSDVVDITPEAVVALEAVKRGGETDAPVLAVVREEIIDSRLAARLFTRSARLEVQLDCAKGAYRIQARTRFTLPDLQGAQVKTASAAPGDWKPAGDGSVMAKVVHVACASLPATPVPTAAVVPVQPPIPVPPPPPPTAEAPRPQPASARPRPAFVTVGGPVDRVPSDRSTTAFTVQLGSYSSPERAHQAGADLSRDFPRPMLGRAYSVRQASAKGRDYFLLMVRGFSGRSDAAAFCRAVQAEPSGCIIRD